MVQISEILANRGSNEPPEIKAIKAYVKKQFDADVSVGVQKNQITISAPNSALAATLQLNKPDILKLTGGGKRLVIRIG